MRATEWNEGRFPGTCRLRPRALSLALPAAAALALAVSARSALAIGPYPDVLVDLGGYHGVLLNQGGRRFGQDWIDPKGRPQHYDADYPAQISRAFGDVNGDGRLDDIRQDFLYLGHGDGNFGLRTTAFVNLPYNGLAFASGDLNGDGRDDVVVGTSGLRVYFGRPDGTLKPAGPGFRGFENGGVPPLLRLVDLDRDGNLDLIGASAAGPLLAYGKGGGEFERVEGVHRYLTRHAIADFNGDGKLDIATTGRFTFLGNRYDPDPPTRVHIYLGRLGGLQEERTIPVVGLEPERAYDAGIAAGEMTGDGRPDILVGGRPGFLVLLVGRGDGTFEEGRELAVPTAGYTISMLYHDLDLDGREDLLVSYYRLGSRIYWGDAGGFVDFGDETIIDLPTVYYGFVPIVGLRRSFLRGDANDDGRVDLSDAVRVLQQLFAGARVPCGDASDVNDSSEVDLTDAIHLLNFLYREGPPPAEPYPEAGADPTPDEHWAGQGVSRDLGCAHETFYKYPGHSSCGPEIEPEDCPPPKVPIRQIIDMTTFEIIDRR